MTARSSLVLIGLIGLIGSSTRGEDAPLALGDLAAYHAAIATKLDPAMARPATFADLWDHPAAYQGRPVRVEGRLARLFRQPAVGQFPPLAEAWITSPRGEPTCIVFPTRPREPVPGPGDRVEFAGTFLRQVAYQGGDTKRVAPLIVGPAVPSVLEAGSKPIADPFGPIFGGDHAADWGIGLAASLGVVGLLARRHLSRPVIVGAPVGPAPMFLDGDSDRCEGRGDDDDDE